MIGTVVFTILAALWMYPIIMVVMNSLKVERAITTEAAFTLPTAETFAGITNYVNALGAQGFLKSFGYSLVITVTSVFAILLCCSMCAWYINRVNGFIYHAHIEQHKRIANTEVTVITKLYPKLFKKPCAPNAFT